MCGWRGRWAGGETDETKTKGMSSQKPYLDRPSLNLLLLSWMQAKTLIYLPGICQRRQTKSVLPVSDETSGLVVTEGPLDTPLIPFHSFLIPFQS